MKEIFMDLKDNNIMFVPTIDNGPITRYHVVSRFVLYESMDRYGFITWVRLVHFCYAQCGVIFKENNMSNTTMRVRDARDTGGSTYFQQGLGLWKVDPASVGELIHEAISVGYRHDNAADYGNEAEVGRGIERVLTSNLCHREDLWVTTKLWNTFHEPKYVRSAIERTLRDLRLEYLDSYHDYFPIALAYVAPETRYPPGWFGQMHTVRLCVRQGADSRDMGCHGRTG